MTASLKLARNIRVLFVSDLAQTKGHIYRVAHSVAALQAGGGNSAWTSYADTTSDKIAEADVVIVFRGMWNGFLQNLFVECREQGTPIGFDIDDLIFDPKVLTEKNFDYLRLMTEADRKDWLDNRIGLYRQVVLASDFGIVSTSPLAAAIAALQKPAYVLKNGVDAEMVALADAAIVEFAKKPSAQDGRLRLGYASGTPTHQKDFATIAPVLIELMDERPDLLVTIVGHLNLEDFPELLRHESRIEARPLVPHAQLLREYARFDVNLAPLEIGNPFCEAKSALKYVEAALVEVPTIAAATVPYREAIDDGETGWTAQNPKDWKRHIDSLLNDSGERKRLGCNARRMVEEKHGLEAKFANLQRILSLIVTP